MLVWAPSSPVIKVFITMGPGTARHDSFVLLLIALDVGGQHQAKLIWVTLGVENGALID